MAPLPAFNPDFRSALLAGHSVPESEYQFENSTFEQGGYSVIRSRGGAAEMFLMMDHGPLGFAQTCGHGHADALGIWVHIDGCPILVDFGAYRYNAD